LQEAIIGRNTFSLLNELERTQWLPRSEIESLQTRRLNTLLESAMKHSPWHAKRIHEAGLAVRVTNHSVCLDDLCRFPPMNKTDARAHVDQIVWRDVPGGVHKYTTGGSSGEPLIFYFGRARQASDAANRMRAHRWWGIEPGDRELYLWGAPVELAHTDRIKQLRDAAFNQKLLNAFEMSKDRMDQYCKVIDAWQPSCLFGYASSLALLAEHAESRGIQLSNNRLKVVFATGEPLYPHQREVIERVLGVPVAVEYGCRDGGYLAHQAPGGQLLQMSETVIIELLDRHGSPVQPGEMGEVVITNLMTEAQPFIRYRTGDQARLGLNDDPSGRGLHVLEEVLGRQTDFIIKPDGTTMHALALIYVLRAAEGVASFKCIQHAPDELEVRIVPDARWTEASRHAVIDGLRARMGVDVSIHLNMVEEIPVEGSGKYRYVVSHARMGNTLADTSKDDTHAVEAIEK
jgi:phenylacetate-CoA ligase